MQAVCDIEETIIGFSVTTRRTRFRPKFEVPPQPWWWTRRRFKKEHRSEYPLLFRVRLGKSRFAELPEPIPLGGPVFAGGYGARTFSFSEIHYFGNPGNYETFIFTASSGADARAPVGDVVAVGNAIGPDGEWPAAPDQELDEPPDLPPAIDRFRHATSITTFTVLGAHFPVYNYPTGFGPHGDEVRTLP